MNEDEEEVEEVIQGCCNLLYPTSSTVSSRINQVDLSMLHCYIGLSVLDSEEVQEMMTQNLYIYSVRVTVSCEA